jgi:hypothetical protein
MPRSILDNSRAGAPSFILNHQSREATLSLSNGSIINPARLPPPQHQPCAHSLSGIFRAIPAIPNSPKAEGPELVERFASRPFFNHQSRSPSFRSNRNPMKSREIQGNPGKSREIQSIVYSGGVLRWSKLAKSR